MKALFWIGISFAVLGFGAVAVTKYPEAKISIKVTEEGGTPVPNAEVGIGFEVMSTKYFGNEMVPVSGKTNAAGEFSASALGDRSLGFTVKKTGYYPTTGTYSFKEAVANKWQPWNPTLDVVLRRIGTPVPMYARRTRLEIPAVDEPIGFDLVMSDWVAPYGKGTTADFVFTLGRKWIDKKDFDARLTLTVSRPGNGIQAVEERLLYGSELKLPRTAPEDGYEPKVTTSVSRVPGKPIVNEARDNRSYIYRVRTVLDEKGQVITALYGKLRGDIRVDPINSKTALVLFTYYLNGDSNDRNLEFDPKRNLLGELKSTEQVSNP
jgi:hypothetical protein